MKRYLPFVFAIACGLIGMMLANNWVAEQKRAIAAERQKLLADYKAPVEVIVAARDLPENTTLGLKDLRKTMVPEKFIQPFATAQGGDLLGMVTVAPIAEGEQVLTNKVKRPTEIAFAQESLSKQTPEGKRAVTIGTDALTGVGGFVRPGDTVDVLWTVRLPKEQGGEAVTFVLFQHVNVLAIGNRMVGMPVPTEQKEQPGNFTVTLALTPQETALLLYAREQGRIELSLRSRSDEGQQLAIAPASSKTVMETILGPQAMAPTQPTSQRQVEVYRGLDRSVVAVTER